MKILVLVAVMLILNTGTSSAGLLSGLICNKDALNSSIENALEASKNNVLDKSKYEADFDRKLSSKALEQYLNKTDGNRDALARLSLPKDVRDKKHWLSKRSHINDDYMQRYMNYEKYFVTQVQRIVRKENYEALQQDDKFIHRLPVSGDGSRDNTHAMLTKAVSSCADMEQLLVKKKACAKTSKKKGYDTLCGRVGAANKSYGEHVAKFKEKLVAKLEGEEKWYEENAQKRLATDGTLHDRIEGEYQRQEEASNVRTGIEASYRGLSWGSKPLADMKLIKDEGKSKTYTRKESMKVGSYPATQIKYYYGKNAGLYAIEASMRPTINPANFFKYAESLLGQSDSSYGTGAYEKQMSWNQKHLYAKYVFNPYSKTESPLFFVASQKQMKQTLSGNR